MNETERDGFSNFVDNIYKAICNEDAGMLLNCTQLQVYLETLKLSSVQKLYDNCVGFLRDSSPDERKEFTDKHISDKVANEIARRYLIGLPKAEYLSGLKVFLQRYFKGDPLLDSIDDLCNCTSEAENWYGEEHIFQSKLSELVVTNSRFTSEIRKVLLVFQPRDVYFSNIVVTARKDDEGDPKASFKRDHMVDGLIRRVCTSGILSVDQIFPQEYCIEKDFEMAARKAQENLIATGKIPKGTQTLKYDFMDELAYCTAIEHKGSSAGLALGYLAHAYHNSLDNRLAPYIAICGSLSGDDTIRPVSNIDTKVRVAKENGIRVIVLPEENIAELGKVDDVHLIGYPTAHLDKVIDHIHPIIEEFHTGFLGPKAAEFWNDFIENSREQLESKLGRVKGNAKYRENKYVGRETELDFEAFLKNSGTNCMAIVGESGTGKSCLLCKLCDERVGHGDIVLFLEGSRMYPDRTLEDSILGSLKPAGLDVSSEDFIGIVNDTAKWQGTYFVISLDAINEAEIGPRKALRAVERLLDVLQRVPSDRTRILLTCRSEIWRKVLSSRPTLKLSEHRYYGTIGDGRYVPYVSLGIVQFIRSRSLR